MHSSFEVDRWELESAEARALEYPDKFKIPSRKERESVQIGATVKLLFLFMNEEDGQPIIDCERIWVNVSGRSGQEYLGVLTNQPATSNALSFGAKIGFGPEHIAVIMIRVTDPRHPNYAPTFFGRLLRWLRARFFRKGKFLPESVANVRRPD